MDTLGLPSKERSWFNTKLGTDPEMKNSFLALKLMDELNILT